MITNMSCGVETMVDIGTVCVAVVLTVVSLDVVEVAVFSVFPPQDTKRSSTALKSGRANKLEGFIKFYLIVNE